MGRADGLRRRRRDLHRRVLFAGALSGSIGARATVLVGAGLSALACLACLVVFVPGIRDPERADYAPVPLPEEIMD